MKWSFPIGFEWLSQCKKTPRAHKYAPVTSHEIQEAFSRSFAWKLDISFFWGPESLCGCGLQPVSRHWEPSCCLNEFRIRYTGWFSIIKTSRCARPRLCWTLSVDAIGMQDIPKKMDVFGQPQSYSPSCSVSHRHSNRSQLCWFTLYFHLFCNIFFMQIFLYILPYFCAFCIA